MPSNNENINFQPEGAVIPDGYLGDFGLGYDASRGYGWVTQESLGNSTPTPVDLSGETRDRNADSDQRLDTLIHLQLNRPFGAWEYDLVSGSYEVTVGVGDPVYFDSNHAINIEGVEAIAGFQPNGSQEFATATATVEVNDGKLTVDALGGNNTKLNYIEINPADGTPPEGDPEIEVENLDGVPFSDRLAFSRIGSLDNPPANGVHDLVTLRVNNTGDAPLKISDLSITGPWQIENNSTVPTAIAAGDSLDLPIRFTATGGDINSGSLTIESNDDDEPETEVQLSGFWQSRSEDGQEPDIQEIVEVFGYDTEITGLDQELNQQGLVQAVGDEILSPYWQTADSSQPVTVRQLAAYHSYPATATVFWHPKDSSQTNTIFTHEAQDGQSLLPRQNNSDAPAAGTFNSDSTFGFKIDPEWSDPNRNNQQVDLNNGSPGPAGHHVRFWPARDTEGELIDNTYLMVMDYAGINYDYNDNVYLVSNVTPEPQEALYRIDVGSDSDYTDSNGNIWSSDTGLFEPSNLAVAQSKNLPIANTEDDLLYQTYRGKIEGFPPQDQRTLSFELPVDTSEELNVKLHFAETYWGLDGRPGEGQRIFDIAVEGETVSNDFEIVTEATGALNAMVIQIGGIQVDDGVLNLELDPEIDFAHIAGIEVLQPIA